MKAVRPPLLIMPAEPALLVSKKSVSPELVLLRKAEPALLVLENIVLPALLLTPAAPAVLVLRNCVSPPKLLIMAVPAVLPPLKFNVLKSSSVGWMTPDSTATPVPVIFREKPDRSRKYAGAPVVKWRAPTDVFSEKVIVVVRDAPNVAVPAGTKAGVQLAAVFQSLERGLRSQVAFHA